MSNNADTQRTFGELRAERSERASAHTIFTRVMNLVEDGCRRMRDMERRGDLTEVMSTAARIVSQWLEGCSAYQRLLPGFDQDSPLGKAAASLIASHHRLLLEHLDRLLDPRFSDAYRGQARELRTVVFVSFLPTQAEATP